MSGTTWTVMLDGEPLTWEACVKAWGAAHPRHAESRDPRKSMWAAIPLEFDVAEGLSSKMALSLVEWLRSWLPNEGRGRLRTVPTVPTQELARMVEKPTQVRL